MNTDRLIKLLIHPFMIGLLISVPILVLTLPEIPRYRAIVKRSTHLGINKDVFYVDLDHDRISEEIRVDRNPTMLKIMLFSGPRLIDQYNFLSEPLNRKYLNTGDHNRDGFSEIYLFTRRNDSVFLSIIDPFIQKTVTLQERLIFFNDTISYELDHPDVSFFGLTDYSGDGMPDLVFAITSGYSKRPRAIYLYDILKDTLIHSPTSAANIMGGCFCNLDKDSIPELVLSMNATGNYNSAYPYLDYSTWLMVLDHSLRFHFEPVEFKGFPASLSTLCLMDNSEPLLVVLHEYYGPEQISSGLYMFDKEGNLTSSRELEVFNNGNYHIIPGSDNFRPSIYLVSNNERMVRELNTRLEVIDHWSIPSLNYGNPISSMDIDLDGRQEHIFRGEKSGTFVIFREDLRHALEVDLGEKFHPGHMSNYLGGDEELLYWDFLETGYFLEYGSNGWYVAKFPLAAAFYVAASLLILLIYRVQRYRAERLYQTRRKISELQILSLKNQIDPHFTFNILNSLGHLYTSSDLKERSYELFVKYSRLLRKSVENSDRTSVSLRNELDFVNTYIDLEQLRSHPPFQYTLEVGDEVNPDMPIPRMLIHTFVENSIKHGIHQLPPGSPGELEIRVSSKKGHTTIAIRDNGPGLHSEQNSDDSPVKSHYRSTGKGLKIIDELIGLFNSLEGVKIGYSMKERKSAGGTVEGMEVRISL